MGLSSIVLAGQAAGTVIGASSQYQAGAEEQKLAKYNAQVLEYQAQSAEKQGQADVAAARRQREQVIASQRVGFAAGNVDVNSGTAFQVQQDTAEQAEYDIARLKNNAALSAWGFRQEAANQKYKGKMAKHAGTYNAIGTLLGGAGEYYQLKNALEPPDSAPPKSKSSGSSKAQYPKGGYAPW